MKDLNEAQLYHVYDDGDGHRYLVPKEEVNTFYNFIDDLDDALDKDHIFYEELFADNLSVYLEQYDRLEGEEFYVVLANDLEEGI